jgi:hypothetical protein
MTNPFAIAMEGVNLNPNGDADLPAVPDWRAEYAAKRKALADLMEAHKVTVTATRVDKRPDVFKDDSDWHKDSCHAAFDVLQNGRVIYSGHYSAGSLAALPDTFTAFQQAYGDGLRKVRMTFGEKQGLSGNRLPAVGMPDIRKTFDRRQSMAKTSWESDVLDVVRRAWLPESVDVIQSLLSSATDDSFESWCGDCGYDTDSRKAEKIYFDCRECERVMRRCFGPESYYAALEIAREL